MTSRSLLLSGAIAVAFAALAIVAHAQSAPVPATLTNDPLLAEVRALRADLHQASSASIRAQLLVARLQLQEQRIAVLSGQLADVRRQLSGKESAAAPMADSVKRIEAAARTGSRSADEQRELETQLAGTKAMLARMEHEISTLKAQETALANQIAAEQNRWSDFNSRLDELERQLSSR